MIVFSSWLAGGLIVGRPAGVSRLVPGDAPASAAAALASDTELARDLGLLEADVAAVDLPVADRRRLSAALGVVCRANLMEFAERRSAIRELRERVRALQTRIELGLEQQEQLSMARQRLSAAEAGYAGWLERIRGDVTRNLSDGARAALRGSLQNRALPTAYRGLRLTSAQRSTLQINRARHYARLALARSPAEREAIQMENEEALVAILGCEKAMAAGVDVHACRPPPPNSGSGLTADDESLPGTSAAGVHRDFSQQWATGGRPRCYTYGDQFRGDADARCTLRTSQRSESWRLERSVQ